MTTHSGLDMASGHAGLRNLHLSIYHYLCDSSHCLTSALGLVFPKLEGVKAAHAPGLLWFAYYSLVAVVLQNIWGPSAAVVYRSEPL